MRVADFFCGGGGFSEGFRQAGFQLVFAVDKWLPAVKTYRGNKPDVKVLQDDVIRISELPDKEFDELVPDTEVIIGSPPCQSFSHSNKSGNADKTLGIKLIKAYLRIIARKKFKDNSVLKYWVLENVPAVKKYIQDEYTAEDLGLKGDFILRTQGSASGQYNAKYFGAPTNRERYLCGDFPGPVKTQSEKNLNTLQMVLDSLGDPLEKDNNMITDMNYPTLIMPCQEVTDHHYLYELADFEVKTARRLKQDKGYMGKMSFPENISKPARTVMATMSTSSRESMILGYKDGKYRLPTVREVATMMGFPIDYWFYGESKGIKHTLVGNAVSPKLSYAIAKAIAEAEMLSVPNKYIRINHDSKIDFYNLNGVDFEKKKEIHKREVAKFKYHIPYLIVKAYRVELTNYHSNFQNKEFKWDVEIRYSQGRDRAKIYIPVLKLSGLSKVYQHKINRFISRVKEKVPDMNTFQKVYCMTTQERKKTQWVGPYELLDLTKKFIEDEIDCADLQSDINIEDEPKKIPLAIWVGYYVLTNLIYQKGEK